MQGGLDDLRGIGGSDGPTGADRHIGDEGQPHGSPPERGEVRFDAGRCGWRDSNLVDEVLDRPALIAVDLQDHPNVDGWRLWLDLDAGGEVCARGQPDEVRPGRRGSQRERSPIIRLRPGGDRVFPEGHGTGLGGRRTKGQRSDRAGGPQLADEAREAKPKAQAVLSGLQAVRRQGERHGAPQHRDIDGAERLFVEEEAETLPCRDALHEQRSDPQRPPLAAHREGQGRPDAFGPGDRSGIRFAAG